MSEQSIPAPARQVSPPDPEFWPCPWHDRLSARRRFRRALLSGLLAAAAFWGALVWAVMA